ncbi:transglycosylase SLT domain-containing protein [Geminicoccus flavidas]|uniref:transglycosylase SLT domain-containing protein n=1 Tax=Geminicoccus flavidas TaxID=2506407 RepID=UPI001358B557|nr:transglycosylase SLT domain-containing protein [Geminicoccus flavidas]
MPLLLALLTLLLPFAAGSGPATSAEDTARTAALCLDAASRAERLVDLPEGIVTGIMLAETGRWSKALRRSYPWPWTVTSGSEAWYADSRAAAIATVRRLQAEGRRNIDVGCMQINLYWHPDAFRTIEEALDPIRNVAYGIAFLGELYAERGSWRSAVAAYHSRDPERGRTYLARVEKLQEQYRSWGEEVVVVVRADTAPAGMKLFGRLGPTRPLFGANDTPRQRAVARGGLLLAALAPPAGVATGAAPGSLIQLRRDLKGSRVVPARSFLFSGTTSASLPPAQR